MFVTPAYAHAETQGAVDPHPVPADAEQLHGETVHAEGGHGGFPPFDSQYFPSQLLWLAITFGLFYLVLQRVILPRLGAILENRRARIALDLEAAERMRADADEALAAYEQELTEARARSQKIALTARDAARTDADRERASAEAELDRKLDAAQARIAEIKREALSDVGQIAEDATETILTEVAGLSASRDEIADAVRTSGRREE